MLSFTVKTPFPVGKVIWYAIADGIQIDLVPAAAGSSNVINSSGGASASLDDDAESFSEDCSLCQANDDNISLSLSLSQGSTVTEHSTAHSVGTASIFSQPQSYSHRGPSPSHSHGRSHQRDDDIDEGIEDEDNIDDDAISLTSYTSSDLREPSIHLSDGVPDNAVERALEPVPGLPIHFAVAGPSSMTSDTTSETPGPLPVPDIPVVAEKTDAMAMDDSHRLTPEALGEFQQLLAKIRKIPGYRQRQQERRSRKVQAQARLFKS